MLYAKKEEISALKLSNYYKDKENDELKLKISELESELQVKNSPIQNELGEINISLSEQKQGNYKNLEYSVFSFFFLFQKNYS